MSEQVYAEKEVKIKKIEQPKVYPMMIPTYEIFRDPNDAQNIVAIPLESNLFTLLMDMGNKNFELVPVDYEIFRQDQLYELELEKKKKELLDSENEVKFDPDVKPNEISPEEEMTSLRANELYTLIMAEWDEIVLGKSTGDWEHDLKLQMAQADYFSGTQAIVYERAWEVNDIMTVLVEEKYQPATLFGDYKKIYLNLQTLHDKECARELVKLVRLMSRCVSPETIERQEDLVEATIPAQSLMKNA